MKSVLVKLFCLIWSTVIYDQLEILVEKSETELDNIALKAVDTGINEICKLNFEGKLSDGV